jgi:medium-chain acyl-[acyl-carrier-protein] hydrolase
MTENKDKCFPFTNTKVNASIDLFCLHYAGGSSAVFKDWNELFPDWIAVHPIELAGRGSRIFESAITNVDVLISELQQAIQKKLIDQCSSRHWAIFGHSLGAALGYRICQQLQETLPPLAFFPSGRHAPTLHDPAPKRGDLSDQELIEEIRFLGGSSEEALQNKELMDLLLPMIRADFIVSEAIQKKAAPVALTCPVHVFAGTNDPEVPVESLSHWQHSCQHPISIDVLQGNHFFLHDKPTAEYICDVITQQLKKLLDPVNQTPKHNKTEKNMNQHTLRKSIFSSQDESYAK